MKVTVLGSGTPIPDVRRAAPAFIVHLGDRLAQIDAGGDCVRRQLEAGIAPWEVTQLFLTHLHSDHVLGMPHLLMAGWDTGSPAGGRERLSIYGPPGIERMKAGLFEVYADDIEYRIKCGLPEAGMLDVSVTETGPGVVVDSEGLKVTAAEGVHSFYNLAYRFDYSGRSVAFSGDTTVSDDVIKLADGCDVLFHDGTLDPYVYDWVMERGVKGQDQWARLRREHSRPEDAGYVASAAGVGKLVLVHVHPDADRERAVKAAAREFSGEILVAEDLAEFDVWA